MPHRSNSIYTVFFGFSFIELAHAAAFGRDIQWQWYPAAGFAREYDGAEDTIIASVIGSSVALPSHGSTRNFNSRKKRPADRLILLGEDSIDTRIHRDGSLRSSATKKGSAVVGTIITSVTTNSIEATIRRDAGNSAVSQVTSSQEGSRSGVSDGQEVGSVAIAVVDAGATNATEQSVAQTSGQNAAVVKQPLATQSWFSFLRFTFSFAFVVKALCMMCNIFYQASPLPLISQISAKGDTGDADLAPFVATAYGGWQWCFYGLFAYIVTQKSGFLVLVYSNVVGATLGLYYVYTFNLNCKNTAMLQRGTKYYLVLGSLVLIQFIAIMVLKPVSALFFSGLISSVWSTIGSLALISTVSTVYETKSSKSLPVPLLVMGEISAVLWIVCGIVLWDPWITFPNFFSLMVCTFALHLCWRFPAKGQEFAEAATPESDIMSASRMEATEDCSDVSIRASPLQRALAYVRSSSTEEFETLQDHVATSSVYGAAPETGGTGDSC